MATKWAAKLMILGIAATVVLASGMTTMAKKPVPPPPPFTFEYRVQLVVPPYGADVYPRTTKMNYSGQAAGLWQYPDGIRRGYMFDSETGEACWDLSQLVAPEYQFLVPPGSILSARWINDLGEITGTLTQPDGSTRWAYLLDTANGSLRVIDDDEVPSASKTEGYGINDMGDVLGRYFDDVAGQWYWFVWNLDDLARCHLLTNLAILPPGTMMRPLLNNFGQVAGVLESGSAFRYTPGDSPEVEYFPEIDRYDYVDRECVTGFNNDGVFCGRVDYNPKEKGGRDRLYAFRCFDTPGVDIPIPVETFFPVQWASLIGINSSCDLMVLAYGEGGDPASAAVYHESSKHLFRIEGLFDSTDLSPEELELWQSRGDFFLYDMTDRYPIVDDTTVGRLYGAINVDLGLPYESHIGVLLTPVYD